MLKPRHIVFVGGSALEPAIEYNRKLGFAGDCYVVNPTRDQLCGLKCYRSARDLPAVPDVAFVAVPAERVVDAIRDLAGAGVGAAVINSSGFAETGDAGRKRQDALDEAAGEMPYAGPNCAGFANFLDRSACMLANQGLSNAGHGVAVISAGGAYIADIAMSDRSLPVAFIAGLGNQANLSLAELFDLLLDDERVRAINLYFESIRDVRRLSEAALKAHHKGIPVVALKAGKSNAGGRAALTHTASISDDRQITSALFDRLGFVEVHSAGEALETLKMLTLAAAPRGPRVALATSSGTYAVMGADFAEQQGLTLAPSSEPTAAELQPLLADFLQATNPLDIATFQFSPDAEQQRIFETFLRDDYDIALQCMSFPSADTWEDESWYRSARCFAAAAQAAGLPAVFVAPTHEGLPRPAREALIEAGMAPLQGFEHGMQAIAHALAWHRRRVRMTAESMLLPEAPATDHAEVKPLDEFESKALLAGFGVPVPSGWRWCHGAELPQDLRFPVVLKLCDASILHKSEIGGVSLNLASAELLRFAREQIRANLHRQQILIDNFLVEEAIHGGLAELLIGIRRVPRIGYVLTLAMGGSKVERLRDAVNLLLPCDRDVIAEALRSLEGYPTLSGAAGGIATDIDATLDTIEKIIDGVLQRSDIVELEINPLIIRAADLGVSAADAVLRLQTR